MFYRVIFIFSFFLSLNVSANDFLNFKTFEGNFNQTIINASGKEIVYKGKVFIKEPAKILWQYKNPIIKNVYVIANTAIVDEPELEQVIYTRLQSEINLLSLIKKAKKIDENSYIATLGDTQYELLFINNVLSTINYEDTLENKVSISFKEVKLNGEIPNNRFQFLPPEHYDIVRQ